LATGSSPLSVYHELIRRHRDEGLTFNVQGCAGLLDEYVGLPPSHPQSYAHVIREEFTDHVDIDAGRAHGPEGVADDIFTAAAQYDTMITESGPSMFSYSVSASTATSGSTNRVRCWGRAPRSRR
jgi:glucosamine-6-phosphate deaminase